MRYRQSASAPKYCLVSCELSNSSKISASFRRLRVRSRHAVSSYRHQTLGRLISVWSSDSAKWTLVQVVPLDAHGVFVFRRVGKGCSHLRDDATEQLERHVHIRIVPMLLFTT